MKRLLATGAAVLAVSMAALSLSGVATSSALGASSQQRAQAAAAQRLFVKYLSSHATMMRATGAAHAFASRSQTSGTAIETGSYNWSGMADVQTGSTPISSVSARWTIPQVNCVSGAYRNQDVFLAQWIGLDGFTSDTVEQLGTGTQCYEGVEYYYDWYEMFPNGTVQEGTTQCINNNVDCPRPGDQIYASVTSRPDGAGNNDYNLTLLDLSRPQESFTTSASCPDTTCVNSSAEWIVERPAFSLPFGFQILPQADYGQTAFFDGLVSAGGSTTSIENYNGAVYDVAMVDDSDSYILSCPGQNGPPGQLLLITNPNACPLDTPVHGSFSDTWDGSF